MALIDNLTLHCRKATALIEKRDVRPLDVSERLGLWMHLRICDGCRAYQRQSRVIERLLEQRPTKGTIDTSALEARILTRVG